ncbi:16142_t:CDS:2 [Cetraspora pellucida]|uniref:16142_t:CDS:1 n=1 Tax=Cetraspora pellucida TaxID=1433469 RepID=A0ACA9LW04_9GLOM|nr:16142_t:CDS:2 [Cetraspora pellucida]
MSKLKQLKQKKASIARSVHINTNTSTRVAGNIITTKRKSNTSIRTSSNVINLKSNVEYENNSLSLVIFEVNYDSQEDGYFQDNDNNINPLSANNELFNESDDKNKSNNKSVAEDKIISEMIKFVNKKCLMQLLKLLVVGCSLQDVLESGQTFVWKKNLLKALIKNICPKACLMMSPEGENPLRKKELGPGVHVSNFLTETIR